VPPFAAYFRVYEPLVAFDRARQQYWRRYVTAGGGVTQSAGPGRQRRLVLEALGAGWTRLPELPDEAYVITDEGATLICPWNLQIQVARAALSARDGGDRHQWCSRQQRGVCSGHPTRWQDPDRWRRLGSRLGRFRRSPVSAVNHRRRDCADGDCADGTVPALQSIE
jgi:hypothetical protein